MRIVLPLHVFLRAVKADSPFGRATDTKAHLSWSGVPYRSRAVFLHTQILYLCGVQEAAAGLRQRATSCRRRGACPSGQPCHRLSLN